MMRRAGFVVASVAALSMCSCFVQAERERAAEAARREAELAQAEAEEARAKEDAERTRAELQNRWHAVAGGVTVQVQGFGQIDFAWRDPDKFPHPTYKGGSAEAYGAFAGALASFLENDDNFEFLAKNKLFAAELRYTMPSGQVSKWTFADLTEQLSKPNAHGTHDAATRKKLKALADKMKTPPKA